MTDIIGTHRKINLNFRPLAGTPGADTTDQLGNGFSLNALGLWPFWGTAIALHRKQNETRGWYRGYSGLLAIYQTKTANAEAVAAYASLQKFTGEPEPFGIPHPKQCPSQAIVAVARVVGGVPSPAVLDGEPPLAVSFYRGDGSTETRIIPPPCAPENKLGYYDSDENERRFAWILTDVMPLPEPYSLPSDGGNRQGIFRLNPAASLHCLRLYRDFLIDLRPKCRECGSPFASGSAWRFSAEKGWWEHCCYEHDKSGKPDFWPVAASRVNCDPLYLHAFARNEKARLIDIPAGSDSPEYQERKQKYNPYEPPKDTANRSLFKPSDLPEPCPQVDEGDPKNVQEALLLF